MATTASFTATMRTRKDGSSSNYLSSAASQEYYTNTYNFVGIISFPNMSLTNKVITQMKLKVVSAGAGYGAGSTKTVYVRKSLYQSANKSGVLGRNYFGDALGTFTGSFYNNTTTTTFNASTNAALFGAMAEYFRAGNNTITIYNPNPQQGSVSTYSKNYLQWDEATLTVTYEEGVSEPSASSSSVDMGSAVTINTNRLNTVALHTITYSFGSLTGSIGTDVGDSVSWTPPVSLAAQIPTATSGVCTITCDTIYNGTVVGTKTCSLTLTVPASFKPTISSVTRTEAVSGLASQFAGFVRTKSKLSVSITAAGSQGSTITSYRSTLSGVTYTAASFTTGFLNTAGSNTLSVTVTDSRGRTATASYTVTVLDYSPPSLTRFTAERCNSGGTAAQTDGTKVRVNITGAVSSVNSKNTISCKVYYKLNSATAWTQSVVVTVSGYTVSQTNLLLSQTFNALNSYDLKVSLTDYFTTVEQVVSVGTKQVMMDFYRDGSGIAFGKVAETSGKAEFGWPLKLSTALPITEGGTGATTAAAARTALGAAATSHTHTASDVGAAASSHSHALTASTITGTLPVSKGGTGATTAKAACIAIGIFYADTLPASGTDGQICLVPV